MNGVTNATAPTPRSNVGYTADTSDTLSEVILRARINPPPATKYGRSEYSVSRCGAASTTLPQSVVTRLWRTRCLSSASMNPGTSDDIDVDPEQLPQKHRRSADRGMQLAGCVLEIHERRRAAERRACEPANLPIGGVGTAAQ